MMIWWIVVWLGGFGWTSTKTSLIFNYHPFFMAIGFFFLYTNGELSLLFFLSSSCIYHFHSCHSIQEPSSTGCVRAATASSCAQYTVWFWWFHLFSCGSVLLPCGAITRWSFQPPPQQQPPQTQLSQLCVNFTLRIVPFIACGPSFKACALANRIRSCYKLVIGFQKDHFLVRCNVCSATISHRCTVGLVSQYSSSSACSGS